MRLVNILNPMQCSNRPSIINYYPLSIKGPFLWACRWLLPPQRDSACCNRLADQRRLWSRVVRDDRKDRRPTTSAAAATRSRRRWPRPRRESSQPFRGRRVGIAPRKLEVLDHGWNIICFQNILAKKIRFSSRTK